MTENLFDVVKDADGRIRILNMAGVEMNPNLLQTTIHSAHSRENDLSTGEVEGVVVYMSKDAYVASQCGRCES